MNDKATPVSTSRRKGPSLGDVAELAGVSPQTVSRVATGSDLVNKKTEAKVREAMRRLRYVPNVAARALRQGSYQAIAVVTQRLQRTGETFTTAGIVEEAARRGYNVTLVQISDPESDQLPDSMTRLSNLPVDGAIVVRIGNVTNDRISLPPSFPVSVNDSRLLGFYPSVVGDQAQGVTDLMQHLISLGHKNIHHVTGASDSHPTGTRLATYRRVLYEAGLPQGKAWSGDWTIESGYNVGLEIAEDPDVTAVFCANDEMAFGVIKALTEKGVRVPEDISIAGFDNADISRFTTPPMTTVAQNFNEIAKQLVDQLLNQIDNPGEQESDPILVPLELKVRESTGPVRAERKALRAASP